MNTNTNINVELIESLKTISTARLVDEAAALKEKMERLADELNLMKQELAGRVEFRRGSGTSHAFGRVHSARIQMHGNLNWDQEALERLKEKIGEDYFYKIFRRVYEPKNQRALSGALRFGPYSSMIEAAASVSPGEPQVSFEPRDGRLPAGIIQRSPVENMLQ
ncbi:hypothetical protein C4J81_12765 [Deltaproteobacteria bacterium Smac51]|nr:hypothetical protein C4J81_12765 [Deltaproteobacteria bacterium Smac51]